ncbi:MAG: peptidoglycan recognition family protein [Pseudomonadota bacterium]
MTTTSKPTAETATTTPTPQKRKPKRTRVAQVAGGFAAAGLIWCAAWIAVIGYLESRARWDGAAAPRAWVEAAKATDRLDVPGHRVAYWGKPDARYSRYATRSARKPVAIVVHFTYAKPVRSLVEYGHMRDYGRGGASFGYHFYVGREGRIVQGAPLSRRTNHIKFHRHPNRTATARHLWSGNTIAVSLVGGCDPLLRPDWRRFGCSGEFATREQLDAGFAVIKALQDRFGIACREVYGHGDLQTDRKSFEGRALTRKARASCGPESS